MTQRERLLQAIDEFLPGSGMSATTFGRLAVGDGKFVARVRGGGGLTTATADRVEQFIRDELARGTPRPGRTNLPSGAEAA
jgi:hypothetical protein